MSNKYRRLINGLLASFFNKTILNKGVQGKFVDHPSSITVLKSNIKSVIRWGDGESLIFQGGNIYFQPFSENLKRRLYDIVKGYRDDSRYHLTVPGLKIACHNNSFDRTSKGEKAEVWQNTRYVFWRFFNKAPTYLDTGIFKGHKEHHLNHIADILNQFDRYLIVSSSTDLAQQFFSSVIPGATSAYIDIPPKNAFAEYDRILMKIKDELQNLTNQEKTKTLILISAGPCAKVLVYELSQADYVAFDIGKMFKCWIDWGHI